MYRFGCKRTAFSASQVAKVSLFYSTTAMKLPLTPSLPQKRRTATRGSEGKETLLNTPSTLDPAAKDYLSTTESISVMTDSLQQVLLVTDYSPLPSIPLQSIPVHINTPPTTFPTASKSKKQIKNQPNVKSKRDAAGRQQKVQPSKASGGIPNPSPEYLMRSKAVPYPLHDPQDLLVIIDLNGTLLYRPNKKQPTKFLSRPHASLFLKYCIDTFRVVIWSSARPENVAAMCNSILTPEMRRKVVAIWGRDKFNLTRGDFDLRVQCYKRLTSIWQDPQIASSHPHYLLGGKWDQTNTVLVDDSLDKGRSEPFNLIEVPEWTGDMQDGALPQVHDHLNHLSLHSNVSGCHYARPFQPKV
jgi:hypothetical protein